MDYCCNYYIAVLVFDNEGGLADSTMSELRDITKLLKESLAQDKQLATLLEVRIQV